MPATMRAYGTERVGVMSLLFAFISYLTLLDLGLSRALTKSAAEMFAAGRRNELGSLYRTALLAQGALGTVAALLAVAAAYSIGGTSISMPSHLRGEAATALTVTALSLPVVLMVASTGGLLQAVGRFDLVAAAQIASGLAVYVIPIAVAPWTRNLAVVMGATAFVRVLTLMWLWTRAKRILSSDQPSKASAGQLKVLLKFGGWIAVTATIGPLLVYSDRFLIGTLLTVEAVTYYSIPSDLASRFLMVPAAISQALFPVFAANTSTDGDEHSARLLAGGARYLLIVVGLMAAMGVGLAADVFGLWISGDFSTRAAPVFRILMVGITVNALGSLPLALIQARGRPDLGARLHAMELPIYIAAVWVAAKLGGIEGVALAWVGRATLDAIGLVLMARNVGRLKWAYIDRPQFFASAGSVVATISLCWAATQLPTVTMRGVAVLLAVSMGALTCWRFGVTASEKKLSLAALNRGWTAGRRNR